MAFDAWIHEDQECDRCKKTTEVVILQTRSRQFGSFSMYFCQSCIQKLAKLFEQVKEVA
jgi:hypothetical protein